MAVTQTATRRRASTAAKANGKLELEAPKVPVYPDIQTIRDAIPAHCFQPTVLRSMSYVFRDLALIFSLGYAALTYIPQMDNVWLRTGAWIAYGYLQGLFCTGLWILAHECGHGAFSLHQTFNDVVGWAAHSFLMVPYFSWKFSHHRHHRFTGHMEKDMAFVPQLKEDREKPRLANLWMDAELFEDVPIVQLAKLVAHQLAGWQMYLLFNVSAGPKSKQRQDGSWTRVSHFEPTSAVFRASEAVYIAISDVGLAITAYGLYLAAQSVGWQTVCLMYLVPYMWVHHWLGKSFCPPPQKEPATDRTPPVAITYLHHNHPDVPHFDAESWTYVKGALATVDRDFGFVGRHLFHGIIDKHVIHHLFPYVPPSLFVSESLTDTPMTAASPFTTPRRPPTLSCPSSRTTTTRRSARSSASCGRPGTRASTSRPTRPCPARSSGARTRSSKDGGEGYTRSISGPCSLETATGLAWVELFDDVCDSTTSKEKKRERDRHRRRSDPWRMHRRCRDTPPR